MQVHPLPSAQIPLTQASSYLYGGRDPTTPNVTLYDDIYALSLPSFTWTSVYGPGSSPRWGHTCHIVGQRQMITVGGSLNKTYDGCDWEQRGVAIYDLSAALWGASSSPLPASPTIPLTRILLQAPFSSLMPHPTT